MNVLSLTVGELTAYIRADSAQFDRAVDESGHKFSKLGSAVAAGAKAIATAVVAVGVAGVGLGAALLKVGLDYNRLQQSSRAALTTLLGSAQAANAQMDKLDAFARNSPFAKQVFISAQQQLLGFGVAAEKVLPTLDAIQNAVAATGGSNDQISALTDIFAKISSSAKITGEDLNQFGTYGVDAASLIGSQMGKTGAQIRDAITAGTLDAQVAVDALTAGMMARFGGATANIKMQFDGALDRIKGAWRDVGGILAAPFIDPQGGGRAVEWANKVADALRALEQKAKPLVDLLVVRFAPALDSVSVGLDRVRSLINRWDLSKVNGQLDTLAKYAPLVAGTSAAIFALGGNSLGLSRLGLSLNPVVAAVVALVAASPGLRGALGDFFQGLSPLLPMIRDVGRVLSDRLLDTIDELTPAISDLLGSAARLAVTLGQMLGPAVIGLLDGAEPLVRILADVVGWMADLPTPVLAAAAAFLVLNGPLGSLVDGLNDALGPALADARTSMDASRGVAEAMGTQVGFMGAASLTARSYVSSLGTALKTAFLTNPIGIAIAAISTAIGIFIGAQQKAEQRVDDFKTSLDQATGAITENTRAVAFNALEQDGTVDAAKRAGIALDDLVTAAIDPSSDAYLRLQGRSQQAIDEMNRIKSEYPGNAAALVGVTTANEDLWAVINRVGTAQGDVAESQARLADENAAGIRPTEDLTNAVQDHNDALRTNNDLTREAADLALSQREAQLAAQDAQARYTETLVRLAEVNADVEATEADKAAATRDVESALLDVARSYAAETESMRTNNADAMTLNATIRTQRDAFIVNAMQMGLTATAAAALATEYGLIPKTVVTTVVAETTNAVGMTQQVIDNLNTITGRTWRTIVQIDAAGNTSGFVKGTGLVMRFEKRGDILEYMSAGGLRPMASMAQIVPPNTWRVVGDRSDVAESYIPLDGSRRSLALLDETARRLGRIAVPVSYNAAGSITPAQVTSAPRSGGIPGVQVVFERAVIEGTPQDVGREVAWALAGKVFA